MLSLLPFEESRYTVKGAQGVYSDLTTLQVGDLISHRNDSVSVVTAVGFQQAIETSAVVRCVFISNGLPRVSPEAGPCVWLLRNGRFNCRRVHKFDAMGQVLFIDLSALARLELEEKVHQLVHKDRRKWGDPAVKITGTQARKPHSFV